MEVLPRGKVAIARLDRNDVNDHLVLGEGELVKDRLWKARPVDLDSLINAADAWDLFTKETSKPRIRLSISKVKRIHKRFVS